VGHITAVPSAKRMTESDVSKHNYVGSFLADLWRLWPVGVLCYFTHIPCW